MVSPSRTQAGQPCRNAGQHLVAHVVAQAVVDGLEAVQVEKQHGHQLPGALRVRDRLLQPVLQQIAVRQGGECVVVREMGQLPFI